MNKEQANEVRERYADGEAVATLANDYGTNQAKIYKVLSNQLHHDANYQLPRSSRLIVEDFGKHRIAQLKADGYSYVEISRLIEEEQKEFVTAAQIRYWHKVRDERQAKRQRLSMVKR
jgi:hypothetical protein